MQKPLRALGADLLNLFFPRLCPACATAGLPTGVMLCLDCQIHLPYTDYHLLRENPFTQRFWGRLPIEYGAAMLTFHKGGRVQHLLHQLKYKGRQDVGEYLGRVYGYKLAATPDFRSIDYILPIPLHPKRRRERGYNQSACFARGLSETMGIPWADTLLIRRQHTATQTHKSRIDRFENVSDAFHIEHPELLTGKHLLLVDDVLTTGATLEACGALLCALPNTKLSLATIAIASE